MEDFTVTTLKEMITLVQNIAPEVWKLYVKQSLINGLVDTVWGLVLILLPYVAYRILKKYRTYPEKERIIDNYDFDYVIILVSIFAFGALLLGGVVLTGGIKQLLNPEFYAIKELFLTIQPN